LASAHYVPGIAAHQVRARCDLVTVVVTPVTGPGKGSYSLGVSASADPAGVSAAYKLT
jgi:hypothetical protein